MVIIKIMNLLPSRGLSTLMDSGDKHADSRELPVDINATYVMAVIAMLIIFMLLDSSSIGERAARSKSTPMSPKQLRGLIAGASEPQHHRKIAEYFRQEAQRSQQRAQERKEMEELYAQVRAEGESKLLMATSGVPHCQHWADLGWEEAKEPEALALLHEEMARAAESK